MAGKVKDPERNAEAMALLSAGWSFGRVGEHLGMSRSAVAGLSHRASGYDRRGEKRGHRQGEAHPAAKLLDEQVREIRALRCMGQTLHAIAQVYGTSPMTVYNVASGRTRRSA